MEKIVLNEIPVRTSVNFGINDVTLTNVNIPEKIESFRGLRSNNVSIDNAKASKKKLTYGLGKVLEEQVFNNSNKEIKIELNKPEQNIQLDFNFDNKNYNLVDNIELVAKANSSSNIILKYKSDSDDECYHNSILRIKAEDNSQIKVIILNFLNDISNNFLSVESEICNNSKVSVIIADFGGKNSISNYYSNMIGKNAQSTIDTLYIGDNDRLIDMNYIVHLRGEKNNANIEVQGALKDKAIKNFKGTLDFKRGCSKSVGNENEFCMLLSDKAKSKALPMLLCTEDDVEGNHSTASGKVNKSELFYLMSRGFSQKEAMKLLVRAKFTPIIEKIESDEIKKEILEEIDRRLD